MHTINKINRFLCGSYSGGVVVVALFLKKIGWKRPSALFFGGFCGFFVGWFFSVTIFKNTAVFFCNNLNKNNIQFVTKCDKTQKHRYSVTNCHKLVTGAVTCLVELLHFVTPQYFNYQLLSAVTNVTAQNPLQYKTQAV